MLQRATHSLTRSSEVVLRRASVQVRCKRQQMAHRGEPGRRAKSIEVQMTAAKVCSIHDGWCFLPCWPMASLRRQRSRPKTSKRSGRTSELRRFPMLLAHGPYLCRPPSSWSKMNELGHDRIQSCGATRSLPDCSYNFTAYSDTGVAAECYPFALRDPEPWCGQQTSGTAQHICKKRARHPLCAG